MPPWILQENSPFKLPIEVLSSSPQETIEIARHLARRFKKGGIIALKGPLGAGKTCFTKGIASGLGIVEEVTSPTYTIVSEYSYATENNESATLYHIDAYRLNGDDDFSAIGGEEIIFGDGISVIEWSEHIPGFITSEALKIDIEIKNDQKRLIRVYKDENTQNMAGGV